MKSLAELVLDVVHLYPNGLRHVDVVREVLRKGYIHRHDETLSSSIHKILMNLVRNGDIKRKENEENFDRCYVKNSELHV